MALNVNVVQIAPMDPGSGALLIHWSSRTVISVMSDPCVRPTSTRGPRAAQAPFIIDLVLRPLGQSCT